MRLTENVVFDGFTAWVGEEARKPLINFNALFNHNNINTLKKLDFSVHNLVS